MLRLLSYLFMALAFMFLAVPVCRAGRRSRRRG